MLYNSAAPAPLRTLSFFGSRNNADWVIPARRFLARTSSNRFSIILEGKKQDEFLCGLSSRLQNVGKNGIENLKKED
jgi:hypothetical protein